MSLKSSTLFALIALLALCVGYSAGNVESRARYNMERVYDFTVSDSHDEASWRAFGREWRVRLYLSDVVEDNTDYYYGTLDGDEHAVVSFSLLPGLGLSGMIVRGNQTWWIAARPVEENGNSEEEEDLGVFMFREALVELPANVKLPAFQEPVALPEPEFDDETAVLYEEPLESDLTDAVAVSEKRQTTTTRVTKYKVAVFFDQKWALASNNPWSSQADTLGLFNDVNAIYKAAGLATFSVVYAKQVTNSLTSLNDMLSYLTNTISANNNALFSDKSFTNYAWLVGSNVGGLAYVGTSCKSNMAQKQKTGVMGLVSYSRLYTVKTLAHELGHNRGANHQFDNQCSGQTTKNCQCSLMSYCFPTASNNPQGAKNFFSTASITEMKNAGCY